MCKMQLFRDERSSSLDDRCGGFSRNAQVLTLAWPCTPCSLARGAAPCSLLRLCTQVETYLIQDITRGTRYTLLVACMLINETQIVGQVEMGIQLTTTTTTSLVVGWIKG